MITVEDMRRLLDRHPAGMNGREDYEILLSVTTPDGEKLAVDELQFNDDTFVINAIQ